MLNVDAVDRLDMQVRFRAVAGVSAPADLFADLNVLSRPNSCAEMLEMAERDYTAVAPDHDVIAGERTPALADTPGLCQGVSDRRDTAVREMITLSVMRSHDSSCDRREHRAAEADKALRRFRTEEGAEGEGRRSPRAIDRHEVDCV